MCVCVYVCTDYNNERKSENWAKNFGLWIHFLEPCTGLSMHGEMQLTTSKKTVAFFPVLISMCVWLYFICRWGVRCRQRRSCDPPYCTHTLARSQMPLWHSPISVMSYSHHKRSEVKAIIPHLPIKTQQRGPGSRPHPCSLQPQLRAGTTDLKHSN